MISTEDRKEWYTMADNWEVDFVKKYGDRFTLIINPAKEIFKYSPDLFVLKTSVSADLKLLKQPFYKSEKIYGIPPQHCWTFNPSDLFEYSTRYCDNFGIFIWKVFEKSCKYNVDIEREEGVYFTTLFDLKKTISRSGKIHHYIRRMNDTNGNSFGSHGIDLRGLHKLA